MLLPFALLVFAQSTGNVSDIKGRPVAYVFVYNHVHDHWLVTDEQGEFSLPVDFETGDSLLFTRLGYQNQTVVFDESQTRLAITLPFTPLNLDTVTVAGHIFPHQTSDLNLSHVQRTVDLGTIEHRRIWTSIPGLYLKSYGGPTGISTLSLDGSSSTHTKVIIAGFDLTSAQNGQIDISQLPPAFIASINYSPEQAGNSSAENSEGLLNIEPIDGSTGFTLSAGSYGKFSLNANLDLSKVNWNSNLLIGCNYYRGDYEVSWRDDSFIRRNNALEQNYISWQNGYIFNSRAFARLMAFYSEQERGVAGLIWNPSPQALRRDALGFIGLKIGWTANKSYSRIQTLHRHSYERYVNSQIAIDSRHLVTTDQIIYNTNRQLLNLNLDFNSDLKSDFMRSRQAGNHSRTTWTNLLALPWNFHSNYELRPWLKCEYSPDLYQKATWGGRIMYRGPDWLKSISGSYGRYYAYPTFNDLYWQPGGNPDLKPDETTKYELDISLQILPRITILFNGYYKEDENLIQWVPVQSYWQPSNIQQAERKGVKVIINWSLSRWPIDGFLQGVISSSRNLTEGDNYRKALRYTPSESYSAGFNIAIGHFTLRTVAEYVGERIAMYNWPKDVTLAEYFIINTNLSYQVDKRFGRLTFVCGIDNLMDESFESMQGYPEPGRAFIATIEYNVK